MAEHPIAGNSLERGHQASAGVRHMQGKALLAIRARSTFRPILDQTLVPVMPCGTCQDGGLRVVGTVRARHGIQRVHVCDTCGDVRRFDLPDDAVP